MSEESNIRSAESAIVDKCREVLDGIEVDKIDVSDSDIVLVIKTPRIMPNQSAKAIREYLMSCWGKAGRNIPVLFVTKDVDVSVVRKEYVMEVDR